MVSVVFLCVGMVSGFVGGGWDCAAIEPVVLILILGELLEGI